MFWYVLYLLYFVSGFIAIILTERDALDDSISSRSAILILFIALITGPLFPLATLLGNYIERQRDV